MGWIHTIIHGATSGINKVKQEAEKAEKAAAEAATKAANAAKAAAELAAKKAAEAAAAAKKAAEETAAKAKAAAELAAKKAAEAAEAAKEAAEKTGNSFVNTANAASSAAVNAWTSTSNEAKDLSNSVEKEGITVGNGFIQGATVVGNGIEKGGEVIGKGFLALPKYISEQACNIALGSALSAAFVALAADGEEEVSVGSLAVLAATSFEDKVALNTAAKSLAFIVVEPIYDIPDVSSSVGHKDVLEAIIAFLIVKACSAKPKLVIGSGGQFIAGVLIYGITSVVCEGKIPGGFTVWKGAQANM